MKINSLKDSILIVLDKKDSIISLESEINKSKYINNNIIIDLKNVIVKDFLSFFKTLENNQKKKNKSLVFLTSMVNLLIFWPVINFSILEWRLSI